MNTEADHYCILNKSYENLILKILEYIVSNDSKDLCAHI